MRHSKGIAVKVAFLVVVLGPSPIGHLAEGMLYLRSPISQLDRPTFENAIPPATLEFNKNKVDSCRTADNEISPERSLNGELVFETIWRAPPNGKLNQEA